MAQESPLHSIGAIEFEERTKAEEEHSKPANTATLQLLNKEKHKIKKERRIRQIVKAGIGDNNFLKARRLSQP